MATVLEDAKIMASRLVVRLCSRLAEPDKLSETIFATAIAFTFIGAGFSVLEQFEKSNPQILKEYDISFELKVPAAEKKYVTKVAAVDQGAHSTRQKPHAEMTHPSKLFAAAPASTNRVADAEIARSALASPDAANASPLPIPAADAAVAATHGGDAVPAESRMPSNVSNTDNSAKSAVPADSAGTGSSIDLNSVAGADFGAQKMLAMAAPIPHLGNIKPYKQDLLNRLAKNWHPRKGYDRIVLSLTISKDGTVVNDEIIESSGSNKVDQSALDTVEATQFAPLPDWYKGQHLIWKLDLSTIFGEGQGHQ